MLSYILHSHPLIHLLVRVDNLSHCHTNTAAEQAASPPPASERVRLLTFNICHSAALAKHTRGLAEVASVIAESDCHVCAIQEADGSCCATCAKNGVKERNKSEIMSRLLELLKIESPGQWGQGTVCGKACILSRLPITSSAAISAPGHGKIHGSAWIETPSRRQILIYNVHMNWPKFLGDSMRDAGGKKSLEMLVDEWQGRGPEIRALLKDWSERHVKGSATVVMGDMNTLSHLDDSSLDSHSAPFPLTALMADSGFTDAYRRLHPDPVASPGHTYAVHLPQYNYTGEVDGRLDYIMLHGDSISPSSLQVIHREPWPSDHRALLVEVRITPHLGEMAQNRDEQRKQLPTACMATFLERLDRLVTER